MQQKPQRRERLNAVGPLRQLRQCRVEMGKFGRAKKVLNRLGPPGRILIGLVSASPRLSAKLSRLFTSNKPCAALAFGGMPSIQRCTVAVSMA